jgi:excisionase family DNA binding protein
VLNRLLTTTDVAAYLQVDPNTVYRWCREGKIGAVKIGHEWRIDQKDLAEYLRANRNSSPTHSKSLRDIFRRQLSAPEHLMVMLTEPEKVYELEVEFFKTALDLGMPIMKGCWWQQPDVVRQRYSEAGIPVDVLERQGKFAIFNFWDAYHSRGAQGVLDIWMMQADAWKGQPFWGSGSHLLDQWRDNWDSFFAYESQLHDVLCQLPGIILCPCVTTLAVAEGTTHLLDLSAHHHGILLMTKQYPMLMRMTAN